MSKHVACIKRTISNVQHFNQSFDSVGTVIPEHSLTCQPPGNKLKRTVSLCYMSGYKQHGLICY